MGHARDSRSAVLVVLVIVALAGGCTWVSENEPLVMEGSEQGRSWRAQAEALVSQAQAALHGASAGADCRPQKVGALLPPTTYKYFLEQDPTAIEEYGVFEKGTWAEISLKPGRQGHQFALDVVLADGRCVSFELYEVVQ